MIGPLSRCAVHLMQRVWSYALSAYNHTTLIALQKKTQDWYITVQVDEIGLVEESGGFN